MVAPGRKWVSMLQSAGLEDSVPQALYLMFCGLVREHLGCPARDRRTDHQPVHGVLGQQIEIWLEVCGASLLYGGDQLRVLFFEQIGVAGVNPYGSVAVFCIVEHELGKPGWVLLE